MSEAPTYCYAAETPHGILISISADPLRSLQILKTIDGEAKLLGYMPSTRDQYDELMVLVRPWRNDNGYLRPEGHVLGFLASLPPFVPHLRLVPNDDERDDVCCFVDHDFSKGISLLGI